MPYPPTPQREVGVDQRERENQKDCFYFTIPVMTKLKTEHKSSDDYNLINHKQIADPEQAFL